MDNLPYPESDSLLINLPPKFELAQAVKMSTEDINRKLDDSDGNIFVYAGYLKPGLH
jgi:hypothetical protein